MGSKLIGIAAMVGIAAAAAAGELDVELQPPVPILSAGEPIDVERQGHSAPFVGDFNGNGIKDLLVGEYHQGRLRIYENVGTNAEPRFGGYIWFEAGGDLGRVPTECCVGFTPQLVDLEGNGRTDILSGSWPGEIYWFRRLEDGRFAAAEHLRHADGTVINVGSASTAFAVDWNGDGLLDLLIGTLQGDVFFLPNEGQPERPAFGQPQPLMAAGGPVKAPGGDAGPIAADWDGDGRLDLLLGSESGSVLWYRNLGGEGEPALAEPQVLVPASPIGWGTDAHRRPGDWGLRVKICVNDWNENGRLDLLLGDRCGSFRAKPSQTDQQHEEEVTADRTFRELRGKWAEAFQHYRALQTAPPEESDEARRQHENQLAATRRLMQRYRDEIVVAQEVLRNYEPQHQTHGFVWLFQRKAFAGKATDE